MLANETATPLHCYFGLWEGWAGVERLGGPTFLSSTRVMTLWEGTVAEASQSFQAAPGERIANLWWPADRAWFVVTEIDYDSTIVAGSPACIEAVVRDHRLESLPISADLDLSEHSP